jgi:hypothetical protein
VRNWATPSGASQSPPRSRAVALRALSAKRTLQNNVMHM